MVLLPPNEGGVAFCCRCGLLPLVHGMLLDYEGLNASLEVFELHHRQAEKHETFEEFGCGDFRHLESRLLGC